MPTPRNVMIQATEKRADKLHVKGQAVDFQTLLRAEPDIAASRITSASHRPIGVRRPPRPFVAFAPPPPFLTAN